MNSVVLKSNEALSQGSEMLEPPKKPELSPEEKQYALFQARLVLSKLGTMEERRVCSRSLKRMGK